MSKKFTEPPFWEDILQDDPILKKLVDNFEIIKKESIRLNKYLNFLFNKYPVNKMLVDRTTPWKLAPIFGGRYDENINRRATKLQILKLEIEAFFVRLFCPATHKLLKDYFRKKILLNASFSKLSPGSIIKPHIHPSKSGVRRMNIHMGILCDPECKITVGEEIRTWQEGKILAFKSTGPYRHSVIHGGTKDRTILFLEFDSKYFEQYGVFNGKRIKDEK